MKGDTAPHGVTCSCGKLRYLTRRAAKLVIRRMRGNGRAGTHLSTYRCGDYWHVGTLPGPVVHGKIARDDIHRRPTDA